MTRRAAVCVLVSALLVSAALAGCSGSDTRSHSSSIDPSATTRPTVAATGTPIAGARLGGTTPGSLISATTIRGLDPSIAAAHIAAARIVYRSTNGSTGKPTVVSGTIFLPDKAAPAGGWQVVALGHGSTGVQNDCAPSFSPDLFGQAAAVIKVAELGVAVTMADYQGLGEPGIHPYLDSRTAGLNIIDSVRALRAAVPDVSNRWAAIGGSQGGGAVWSANEQASTYAPDLDLMGTVALSPATDVSGLVDRAGAGTLTPEQRATYPWVLYSLARLHPGLDLADYRHGSVTTNWALLTSCDTADSGKRLQAADAIGPSELAPANASDAAVVRGYLRAYALPQRVLSAPQLVGFGGKDAYIDPAWTTAALARGCAFGDVLQVRFDPKGTHTTISGIDPIVWVAARFAGQPVTNQCPRA
ncbi:MAG TPA: lipase family protein [Marmoricola sp.]|jgi:hypothetical protein|nr:lipase family protein [Marmoricola sp.]